MTEEKIIEVSETLPVLADKLVSATKEIMRTAKSEEDLRVGFEKALDPVFKALGIKSQPKYEHTTAVSGRSDAVHGTVIIEYENPGSFKSDPRISHASDQLESYLEKEQTKAVGVGFDGQLIFFVRKQNGGFVQIGPYPVNQSSMTTFLTYLRALSKLALTAENLTREFGPESKIAGATISALVDAFYDWKTPRVTTFFDEWKRIFGIVYGEQLTSQEESKELTNLYGISREAGFQELLFCVHTYFAFLMKLIAAELLSLRDSGIKSSYTAMLAHSSEDELKSKLKELEDGGIYTKRGITNFLEGDFFSWYLDAWEEGAPALKDWLKEITRSLSEFEPATTIVDPDVTRDLLKKLYQYLVPKEVRHKLGEYYTPDWLAELVLNEVGYDGNTLKRVLDPACGSGTFLVLAIQRAKEYGHAHKESTLEVAKRIKEGIWGFDLNPLAVIASRTNYLFALGNLANELEEWEIPVYMADSVLLPEKFGQLTLGPTGNTRDTHTSIGIFHVPSIWVQDKGFLMRKAAPMVEEMVGHNFSVEEAMLRFKKEGLVFPPNDIVVSNFYREILKLEQEGRDGIWSRFLKNALAPMTAGKFDFVVGNPPWIRWDYLSQDYRNATLQLWKDYGLFSLKGYAQMLGGAKPDFSMLFVYASADYYLKDGAKLGFLITQEVFKSKGAGEGFRRFQLGEKKYLKVLKAHDLVSIQPFEEAANKTAAIILKKGEKTEYPVPYVVWAKKKGVGKITTDSLLDEVLPLLQKKNYIARPIGLNIGSWQTYLVETEGLLRIEGNNQYTARSGAYTSPYGVFWLSIGQVLSNGNLIINNMPEKGKRKIPNIKETIEPDLVYPTIRGSDIERWGATSKIFMLLVNDPNNPMSGYKEEVMKSSWPRTYSYLLRFKDFLVSQAAYKKYHEKQGNSFYSQFNIGSYTFAKHKVIWKQMSNDLMACVISQTKTPIGYKTVIPLHTTALIATDNESEAHYLCAIINSKSVRDFIKSFSSAGRGFGTPSVMGHIGIPKFDSKNGIHRNLADLSKKCHQLKAEGKEKEIEELEEDNDKLVKKMFGVKD